MTTKPPTREGFYHWRANEGDEWEIVKIDRNTDGRFMVHSLDVLDDWSEFIIDMPGQWRRIPTPEEMQEAWAVRDVESLELVSISNESKQDAIDKAWDALGDPRETSQCPGGYTCKPVSIVPRESEVEG